MDAEGDASESWTTVAIEMIPVGTPDGVCDPSLTDGFLVFPSPVDDTPSSVLPEEPDGATASGVAAAGAGGSLQQQDDQASDGAEIDIASDWRLRRKLKKLAPLALPPRVPRRRRPPMPPNSSHGGTSSATKPESPSTSVAMRIEQFQRASAAAVRRRPSYSGAIRRKESENTARKEDHCDVTEDVGEEEEEEDSFEDIDVSLVRVLSNSASTMEKPKNLNVCKRYRVVLDDTGRHFIFDDLSDFLASDIAARAPEALWLDILYPIKEDLDFLCHVFDVHPLTEEDILSRDEASREKLETYEKYIFIALSPMLHLRESSSFEKEDDDEVNTGVPAGVDDDGRSGHLFVLLFKKLIITLRSSRSSTPLVERAIREPPQSRASADTLHCDWMIYLLFDGIIDEALECARGVGTEADAISDMIHLMGSSEQADLMRRIGSSRRRMNTIGRFIVPKREILSSLTQRRATFIRKETSVYLRDVLDHTLSLVFDLEVARESINTAQANYLAKVSIEVARVSNRINETMRALTVASSAVLPLNLVAGIFGMNVQVPGQYRTDYVPFGLIILVMAVLLLLLFAYFRKKRLI